MSPLPSVVVVVPTYQEADNIEPLVRRLRWCLPEADVLVVDDGSPDGTADRADALGAALGGVRVLRRPAKAGLGSAYRDGFAWALDGGYEVVVQMDADLSHDPLAVPVLVDAVLAGADLAVGSRYVAGGGIDRWPAHRRLLSRAANGYASAVLGLGVRDVTSGFRAFRADALRAAAVERTTSDGYAFQVEMVRRFDPARTTEVPIRFRQRARGRSKLSGAVVAEALFLVTWWGLAGRRDRAAAPLAVLPSHVREPPLR